MDVSSMLKTNLDEMRKYMEQQRAKNTGTDGVRYNTEVEQINNQTMSSRKM